jgi:Protein of unknown function (DUF1064)
MAKKKKEPVNKFNNKKVVVDGIKFDSKQESEYYEYLKELQETGEVEAFELQPVFTLQEGFKKRGINFLPIKYKADFHVYLPDGTDYVVDVKGMETADFKLKKKMFEKRFPQELKLISFSKIDGGWIEIADLKEARKKRKLEKQAKEKGKS